MKKLALLASVLFAFVFNTAMGVGLSFVVGAPPILGAIGFNALGVGQNIIKHSSYAPAIMNSTLFAGLNKEIWLAELMQKFRPDPSWLKEARDLSMYVENDVLNLADAGADPGIIINYDGTYDIPVASNEDTPKTVQLYTISTEQDQIKWNSQRTRAYDIMSDRVQRHNDTIQLSQLKLASYGIAPSTNSQYTPVLASSGGDDGNGFKVLTLNDLIDLNTKFSLESMNPNGTKPILVLNPTHFAQLNKEDKTLFKSYINIDSETGFDLCGFKAYKSPITPLFNKSTGVRKAYGAVAAPSTDTIASFAFLPKEAGYAPGSKQMFHTPATSARQSDFINFAAAYFAGTMRNKGIGAIYSAAV